jgi:hypothetical protein
MSNYKQTSLDWFLDELLQCGYIKRLPVTELQQAKAMHKEEIIAAHFNAQPFNGTMLNNAEQYYNETFGGNK